MINAFKMIYSSLILQIVVAISGFIMSKLFIENYGSETNGIINTIKQIVAMFSIFSVALTTASAVDFYKNIKNGNFKEINKLLSYLSVYFNKIGFIFIFFISFLGLLYVLFVETSLNKVELFSIIIFLGIGGLFEYILISKYRILLMADQKNYIISKNTTQGVLLNTLLSIILINLNFSISIVLLTSSVIFYFRMISTKKIVEKKYKYISFKQNTIDFKINGKIDSFFYHFPSIIISNSPLLLISFFIGLSEASVFSVYNMIFLSLTMILSVFSSGINAIFGNVFVDDKKRGESLFLLYKNLFEIICFSIYFTAFLMTIPFINLYINNSDGIQYVSIAFTVGLTLSGLFKNIRIPATMIVEVTGHFKENRLMNNLEAFILIIMSFILMFFYGINGILFSLVFTSLIRSIFILNYVFAKILFNNNLVNHLNTIVNTVIFITLVYLFRYTFNFTLYDLSFIDWILTSIITLILSVILFSFTTILFDKNRRFNLKLLKDSIDSIIKK